MHQIILKILETQVYVFKVFCNAVQEFDLLNYHCMFLEVLKILILSSLLKFKFRCWNYPNQINFFLNYQSDCIGWVRL